MTSTADVAGAPAQPDPAGDRNGAAMPPRIALAIRIVETLLFYGTHLVRTLDSRAGARGFAIIAHCFGTASVPPILARLRHGVLRATALLRVLHQRAARGRDLRPLKPPAYRPRTPRPDDQPDAASGVLPRRAAVAARLRDGTRWNDAPPDLPRLPTIALFEARIRRQSLGRAIIDVCLDLGVRPLLCTKALWHDIFDTQYAYRGNLPLLVTEMWRREKAYAKEVDRLPALSRPDQSAEGTRRDLGFLVGEEPAMPHPAPALRYAPAAVATGPP